MMNRKTARKFTHVKPGSFADFLKIHAEAEERRQKDFETQMESFKQAILGKEGCNNAQSTQGKDTI